VRGLGWPILGGDSGSLRLPMSPSLVAGSCQLGPYAHGTWNCLASIAFDVAP
jgi:hypothetical protein